MDLDFLYVHSVLLLPPELAAESTGLIAPLLLGQSRKMFSLRAGGGVVASAGLLRFELESLSWLSARLRM